MQNLARTNVISEASYHSLREKIAMQLEQLQEDLDVKVQIVESDKSGAFPVLKEPSGKNGSRAIVEHDDVIAEDQLVNDQDQA